MMSLTKKSEYALVAVCHLARVGQQVVSAREIAELHRVPLPLLMNVLKLLNQAGHVTSVRGARGGYVLATPPHELSLGSVIRAVEGPVRLVNCVPVSGADPRGCRRVPVCSIRRPVRKLHDQLITFLNGIRVADIAFDEEYREGGVAAEAARAAVQ